MRRGTRGFTLIETLGALALIGIALLGSGGLLLQWHRTSERLERRALAEHALAQEMDAVLAGGVAALRPGRFSWESGSQELSGLPVLRAERVVSRVEGTGLRRVLLSLEWEGGEARRETLVGGR